MSASSPSAVLPSRHQKDCPNVCLRFSWKETGRFTLGDTHRVGNTLVRHNLTPRDTVPIATDFMLMHTLLSIIEPISDSKEIFDIEISNLCGVLVLPFSRVATTLRGWRTDCRGSEGGLLIWRGTLTEKGRFLGGFSQCFSLWKWDMRLPWQHTHTVL